MDRLWPLPVVVLGLLLASGIVSAHFVLEVLGALVLVIVAAKRPDRALLILIALLPFELLLMAKLYSLGVPASVVRPLSGFKEALAIGVIVAGVLGFRAGRKRLDGLDWLALGFVAIALAYALFPTIFAPGAPTSSTVRSLAFRQEAGFALLFLGARHAQLPAGFLARAVRLVLVVATIVAAIAVYEYFFSADWNRFLVQNVKIANYQVQILHTFPLNAFDYRVYGHVAGQQILRVGSVFMSPLTCGFFLVIGFAVGIENVLRRGVRPPAIAALITIGAGLILTQTRAAIIGALVVAFLAFTYAPGRRGGRRIQFALVLLVGLLVAVPAASSTGLAARASTTASSDDPGATDHLQALRRGIDSVVQHPLGQGLGTSAGIGQRFDQVQVVSESSYIQVGNETGIPAMLLFIGLTIAAIRALRRAAVSSESSATASIWAAAIGLAVAAFFLHVWTDFGVSWTMWGLAGAAIGVAERQRVRAKEPVPGATAAPRQKAAPGPLAPAPQLTAPR